MENSPTQPPPLPAHPAVHAVQLILSLGLVLFLADAVVCLLDDSLKLVSHASFITPIRSLLGLAAFLGGLSVYVLLGLTPLVPKRYFLPLTLFPLAAGLAQLPLITFYYARAQEIAWATSLCQVLLTLGIIFLLQRPRLSSRWPLVPLSVLGSRVFSVWNLGGFIALNLLVLLPAVLAITTTSASIAVSHFTEGFVSLRPSGLIMQSRTYRRESDGATVRLVPMSHIAQDSFYTTLANSFPADSLILAEGVSDQKNHLQSKINYGKTASSLGLAEQQKAFKPRVTSLPADVDLDDFSPTTLAYLTQIMPLHTQGFDLKKLPTMLENPPPHLMESLLEDLLLHRNRHLLSVLESQLPTSNHIIIPWGAAHMPGISSGLLKMGFHQVDSQEHLAIPLLR